MMTKKMRKKGSRTVVAQTVVAQDTSDGKWVCRYAKNKYEECRRQYVSLDNLQKHIRQKHREVSR